MIQPLVGKQRLSLELATHRINIWEGSVRSSKTVCSLLAWVAFVRNAPSGPLYMVGKTERTLKRNCIAPLVEWFGPDAIRPNWGDGTVTICGRLVYLVGANDERSSGKIQGGTAAGAYVDEVALIPESFFRMLGTRLSIEGARLFGTTNPDNPNHWLMKAYLKKSRVHLHHDGKVASVESAIDLARFSFNLRDNPTLPEDYILALDAEFTGLWHKRYIQGLWVLAEGAIWDSFVPDVGGPHVVVDLPDIERWVVAVDYGTLNPFHALLIGLGVDERMYVAREWRHDGRTSNRQMTDVEYSAALRLWLADLDPMSNVDIPDRLAGARTPDKFIVDPSASSFIAQMWRDQMGPSKANNAVADGLRSVSSLLSAGRLRIHADCPELIAEMTGYVWDPKAAAAGVEQPLKVNDHGPDALRYGVMGTGLWWRGWVGMPVADAA